jgi:hypothetical protein
MVCPNYCTELMEIYAAHYHAAKPEHVAIARRYFGTRDTPVQFEIVINVGTECKAINFDLAGNVDVAIAAGL